MLKNIKNLFLFFHLNLILKQIKNHFFNVGLTMLYHGISYPIIFMRFPMMGLK